ncbi:MAG: hypothetical protein PHQ80_01715 [Candidatus ainarchaeum sp.]|nr:hypothetical protein [Candidatus ainarchaeum sp.]MDD5096582.1 hypothetical protein [Candidatus ainarchaeum sp.]
MEKKRLLSWGQGNEVLAGMVADFRNGDACCIVTEPADAPKAVSSRKKGGVCCVKYQWKSSTGGMQVESMEYSDENLRCLHSIDGKDGVDSTAFTHAGQTYMAHKCTRAIAKRLFSAASKVKEFVSRIAGWFRTLAGNFYLLSRVDKATWGIDSRFSAPHLQSSSWSDFNDENKGRFAELATEMMVRMHKSGHIFSNPVPSEMMLDSRRALVADPRYIRRARGGADAVDNFILMMRGLMRRGLTCSGTLFYCLSVYANSMEKECRQWYGKSGKPRSADLFQIAKELESMVVA